MSRSRITDNHSAILVLCGLLFFTLAVPAAANEPFLEFEFSENLQADPDIQSCLSFGSPKETFLPDLPTNPNAYVYSFHWQIDVTNDCAFTIDLFFSSPKSIQSYFPGGTIGVNSQSISRNSINTLRGFLILSSGPFFLSQEEILDQIGGVTILSINRQDPELDRCLQTTAFGHLNRIDRRSFTASANILNTCDFEIRSAIVYQLTDADGLLFGEANFFAHLPPQRETQIRTLGYFDFLIPNFSYDSAELLANLTPIVLEGATEKFQGDDTYLEITQWLNLARTFHDTELGKIEVNAKLAHIGFFSFDLFRRDDLGENFYEIDRNSFQYLNSRPIGVADYSAETKELAIPSILTDKGEVADNVVFKLVDGDQLLFELDSQQDAVERLDFGALAQDCIALDEFVSNPQVSISNLNSISWSVRISNLCDEERVYHANFNLLNQDGLMVAYSNCQDEDDSSNANFIAGHTTSECFGTLEFLDEEGPFVPAKENLIIQSFAGLLPVNPFVIL
ncbi:MAG: hypothetical protein GKR91_05430 [Pseudomonadales bacterium]|nr:hypothetical protein [Pseudomonadales bacterium]